MDNKEEYTITTWHLAAILTYLEGRVFKQSTIRKKADNEFKELCLRREWEGNYLVKRLYFSKDKLWLYLKARGWKNVNIRKFRNFDQLI